MHKGCGYVPRHVDILTLVEMPSGGQERVLLTGAYGHGNLGDDLLSILAADELRRVGINVAIAAGSASRVPADFPQSRHVLMRELGPGTRLLLAGGGLFNDAWASDYSRYFASLAVAARVRGASAAAIGLGIESPRRRVGHACLAIAGQALAPFGVRDAASAEILTRHHARDIRVGVDLGWLSAKHLEPSRYTEPGLVSVTIAGETEVASRSRLDLLTAALSDLLDAGIVKRVRGVAMQRNETQKLHDDKSLLDELARRLAHPVEVVAPDDPWEAAAILAQAPLSLGFRLHGLLLAYVGGARVIALSRSQKVTAAFAEAPGATIFHERSATPAAILCSARMESPPLSLRQAHSLAECQRATSNLMDVVSTQ